MHNRDYRLLNTRWDEHGCLEIRARLTPEQGALVIKAMDAAVKPVAECEPSEDSDSHALEHPAAGASADDEQSLREQNKRHRRRWAIPVGIPRALAIRDMVCTFPGCNCHNHLDAHHIVHWAHGGDTSLDNLTELCHYHHTLMHEGQFMVERAQLTTADCQPDVPLLTDCHCSG